MGQYKDISGQRFNRLLAVSAIYTPHGYYWNCVCECGKKSKVRIDSLQNGQTKSCGCYRDEIVSKNTKTHGKSRSPLYKIWHGMRQRCKNKNAANYRWYGAVGIKVCRDWENFERFYLDMRELYNDFIKENKQKPLLDRVNSKLDYSKTNCRWVNATEQANNRSNNVIVNYENKKFTIADLARYVGMERELLQTRIRIAGWSIQRAVLEPKKIYKFKK